VESSEKLHEKRNAGSFYSDCLIVLYLQPYIQVKQAFGVEQSFDTMAILSVHGTDFFFTNPQNLLYGQLVSHPVFPLPARSVCSGSLF